MDKPFIIDHGEFKSYQDLINALNEKKSVLPYIYEPNLFQFYVKLLAAVLADLELTILDADFSLDEINNLLSDDDNIEKKISINLKVNSMDEVIHGLTDSDAKISLFTSGTTGRPKKVKHSIKSLTKGVRTGEKFSNNKWLLAYNPTHMAGLQVFFQALFNQNLLVYTFGDTRKRVLNAIKEFELTHISATPTFYRLLFPVDFNFPLVTNLSLGGEKSEQSLYEALQKGFPNARIRNIYASTEGGSLFVSEGNTFGVKKEWEHLVMIREGELFVHTLLMGELDGINQEWFPTGDLVQVLEDNPLKFVFIGRKSEMVNVGGQKVNPSEVEQIIAQLPFVRMASVYGKSNSVLGKILCADVVLNEEGRRMDNPGGEIKKILKSRLQVFKVPRLIKIVEELKQTRTGKIKKSEHE